MTDRIRSSVLLLGLLAWGAAAAQDFPYTGMQQREIKALSAKDVSGYLAGHGMGLAKVAELNSYPGPKHVLELEGQLELDEAQVEHTEAAFRRMHEGAVRVGAELVDRERELDELFASRSASAKTTRALVRRIAKLQGELRLAHLEAHLEMEAVLSPEQIRRYDSLRGYGSAAEPEHHPDHDHPGHAAHHQR